MALVACVLAIYPGIICFLAKYLHLFWNWVYVFLYIYDQCGAKAYKMASVIPVIFATRCHILVLL